MSRLADLQFPLVASHVGQSLGYDSFFLLFYFSSKTQNSASSLFLKLSKQKSIAGASLEVRSKGLCRRGCPQLKISCVHQTCFHCLTVILFVFFTVSPFLSLGPSPALQNQLGSGYEIYWNIYFFLLKEFTILRKKECSDSISIETAYL